MLEHVSDDIDLQQLLLIAQSFQFISLDLVQKREEPSAVGRSCGGLSTRIHSMVNALGKPLGSILTDGYDSDIIQAPALIQMS